MDLPSFRKFDLNGLGMRLLRIFAKEMHVMIFHEIRSVIKTQLSFSEIGHYSLKFDRK